MFLIEIFSTTGTCRLSLAEELNGEKYLRGEFHHTLISFREINEMEGFIQTRGEKLHSKSLTTRNGLLLMMEGEFFLVSPICAVRVSGQCVTNETLSDEMHR